MPPWNIDVTVEDIIAARHDWERAKARGLDRDRVADLLMDLEDMCRAHVWQLIESRGTTPATTTPDQA